MSRYIDADAVRQYIFRPYSNEESYFNTDIEKMLNSAPSIDIVFCKECKHWEHLNYAAPKEGWCDGQMLMPYFEGRWVDGDDFCSHGKVK